MNEVLVVIPCLNEAAALPGLLRQQLSEPGEYTIVVADGGSTDGSHTIVESLAREHPRLILLHNRARLQSAGVNGAVAALGEDRRWLVRMDAHCIYPPDYVRGLIETAEWQRATSVVVPMISQGETCFQAAAATAQNSRLGTGGSPHRSVGLGTWVDHGHHALMDLELFRQVGGYREHMSHNEDAELDLRLLAAGGRLWLEPRLALGYLPRDSARKLWCQYFSYGRGRAQTLLMHRRRPKLRQVLPLVVPAAALLALGAPLHWLLAIPLLAWAILCLLGGVRIGARAGGGCAMLSGVPAGIMHMAWGLGFLTRLMERRT